MARPALLTPTLALFTRVAAVSLLVLGVSACEDQKPVKTGGASVDPSEQAKIDQGKHLIADAEDALNDKKYDIARKALLKAAQLGVESQRFQIEEAIERVDTRHAKVWASEVNDDFKSQECTKAFKQLQEPLKTLAESDAFTRELRRLVGTDALACLRASFDKKVASSDFDGARKVASDAETKAVLGSAWKKLQAELEASILEALRAQIASDLNARKWSAAAAKIDAMAKKGDATDEQVQALLESVRAGVGPELLAIALRSTGHSNAGAALKQVDTLTKVAHWTVVEPDVAALDTTNALPPELAKKRDALATWAEAQRLGMRPFTKPEVRHAHGRVPIYPPTKADAPSKRDVPHGVQVWVLGASGSRALVTTVDPGNAKTADLLEKVVGWAPTDRLFKEPTIDWLVPDDQLKGQRVWGPLRPPDPLYELGAVVDVLGREIVVQRFADGQNIKLTRNKLRSGRLAPGTKVLTFCIKPYEPAQVVEVPPNGRTAKIKCDGGQEKEDDLAALRAKPELLPTTR